MLIPLALYHEFNPDPVDNFSHHRDIEEPFNEILMFFIVIQLLLPLATVSGGLESRTTLGCFLPTSFALMLLEIG